MTRPHSTYHADCLCGRAVTSETRETVCHNCGRLLVFEWGGLLFDPAGVTVRRPGTMSGGAAKKAAVVIGGAKAKAKGAGA